MNELVKQKDIYYLKLISTHQLSLNDVLILVLFITPKCPRHTNSFLLSELYYYGPHEKSETVSDL